MTNSPNDLEAFESAILSAGTTTKSVIAWDELGRLLKKAPPALAEKEFVALVIDGVNGRKLSGTQWDQLIGLQVVDRDVKIQQGDLVLDPSQVAVKLPETMRSNLERAFVTIIEGSEADRSALAAIAAARASANVLIVPSLSRRERRDRYIASSIAGALVYGVYLLSGPYADSLCRCGYSKCGKFFLKRRTKKRGAPARKYCSPAHGRLGDNEKAAERMKRVRE